MLHIKKTGTQFEAEGKKHTKDFIDSCWNDANHKYENLIYDSSRCRMFICPHKRYLYCVNNCVSMENFFE